MNNLNKKLWREITSAKGQWLAVTAIIIVGLLAFNSTYISFQNLKSSKDAYYEQTNFADVWFNVVKAPKSITQKINGIEGVKQAEGRITLDVSLKIDQQKERVYGRVHSYGSEVEQLNKLYREEGRNFFKDLFSDILLEKQFAQTHGITVGDKIYPIINGKSYTFTVSGIVGSAEYIFPMRTGKDIFPNVENFGVFFTSYPLAKSLWAQGDTVNEIFVTINDSYDEEEVIKQIEEILDQFGLKNTIKRENQLSNQVLEAELEQLENMAYLFPVLFLGVSALIIYILLNRIIENQRSQIGLLKALGYSQGQISRHYLAYGIVVCLLGGVLGGALGQWGGWEITKLYTQFFNIPVLTSKLSWSTFWLGIVLACIFAVAGGWRAVSKVSKLTPAVALRPAPPIYTKKSSLLERLPWIWKKLSLSWKYALRNLKRNRSRTLITILGVTISVGLMVATAFSLDAIDFLLNKHFKETQRFSIRLVLDKPLESGPILLELKNREGVIAAEPYFEVPVKVEKGWKKENMLVVGINKGSKLYNLKDEKGQAISLPPDGIILSQFWQQKLGVKKGDVIKVKPYLGKSEEQEIKVKGFTKQYLDFNGFMAFTKLNDIIDEEQITNNVLLNVEEDKIVSLRSELLDLPHVAFVESSNSLKEKFEEYLGLTYLFLVVIVSFGGVIAISIVYVTNSINLLERRSEMALLRSMGYSSRQLAEMIFKENILLNIIGLILGLPLGRLLAQLLSQSYNQEIMVIPVVIYPRTYILVSLVIILFMFILLWPNFRFIKKLNLVETLKNREG